MYMQKKCYYSYKKNIIGSRFHQYEEESYHISGKKKKKKLTGFKKLLLEVGCNFFTCSPYLLERQGDVTRQLSLPFRDDSVTAGSQYD